MELIEDITNIIKTTQAQNDGTGWFNKSDSQIDYFHTAYYFDINVGNYNKIYEQVK